MCYEEVIFFDIPKKARGTFDEYEIDGEYVVIPCRVKTVSYNEFYKAQSVGLQLEYILVMSTADVPKQKYCYFKEHFYEVIRAYVGKNSRRVELTIKESADINIKIPAPNVPVL